MFRQQGTPKSKKNAFREQGNTRKMLLGTRGNGPPWEALKTPRTVSQVIIFFSQSLLTPTDPKHIFEKISDKTSFLKVTYYENFPLS